MTVELIIPLLIETVMVGRGVVHFIQVLGSRHLG